MDNSGTLVRMPVFAATPRASVEHSANDAQPQLHTRPIVPEALAAPAAATSGSTPQPQAGGPPGPDPTRYGDWEKSGRCIDF
jgi:shikimate dehydrogenase